MELFIPHSPLAIAMIVIVTVLLVAKLIMDANEVRTNRRTFRLASEFIRTRNTPKISIIIELRKRAETLLPLLDHLYGHEYPNLEIVVIVKQTAGTKAQSQLSYYRRKLKRANLKVIKHTKGMESEVVIRRYTTGSFVAQIGADDRLPKGFFETAAMVLLDKQKDVIAPRPHTVLDQTLLRALVAVTGVWTHAYKLLRPVSDDRSFVPGRLYRRKAFLNKSATHVVYAPTLAVRHIDTSTTFVDFLKRLQKTGQSIKNRTVGIIWSGIALLAIALLALLWSQDVILFIRFLVLSYSAAFTLILLSLKGYSPLQQLTLILFAPFSLPLILVLLLYILASASVPKRRTVTTRKPLLTTR